MLEGGCVIVALPAGAAEAARAAVGFIERVGVRKFRREKRQDHELHSPR